MNKLLTFLILIAASNCFSQTQAEMNKIAFEEYDTSNNLLNETYNTILSNYQDDTVFIENLKKSQRIWIQFRDAELKMKYPEYPDKPYGTIQPVCRAFYLKELTDTRIKTLQIWVRGIRLEACSGSLKNLEYIDSKTMQKATIRKDSLIWLASNMKKDYRIFGYKEKNTHSTKMILFSIFTNEVKNNPFDCKYGAHYETNGIVGMSLKFISTHDTFIKVAIIKNGKTIDIVYMEKRWFQFEE